MQGPTAPCTTFAAISYQASAAGAGNKEEKEDRPCCKQLALQKSLFCIHCTQLGGAKPVTNADFVVTRQVHQGPTQLPSRQAGLQDVCSRRSKANSSYADASTLRQRGSASADRGARAAASASGSQNLCHKMAAEVAACAPKPRLPPAHYVPLLSCRVAGSGCH